MSNDFLFLERSALLQNDKSLHRFSPSLVRNTHDGAFKNLGNGHEARLHFHGEYVEAARNDHVLFSVNDIEKAVIIVIADVPCVVPTEGVDLFCSLGQVVITGGDEG